MSCDLSVAQPYTWKEGPKELQHVCISRNIKVCFKFQSSSCLTSSQFLRNGETAFGEVRYYFQRQINNNLHTLALISVYGSPDASLYQLSQQTVKSCKYLGDANLLVIDVKTIHSVVAMVPHNVRLPGKVDIEDRWFVVEKPGLKAAYTGGFVDSDGNEENESMYIDD
jgi:hypothetical protein